LETHGVTVVGYRCDEMPAFYTRRSGLAVDARADSREEVARLARARDALGLEAALVVCVPVPEAAEVDAGLMEKMLAEALSAADEQNVAGRDLTPFLLAHMSRRSSGATLRANVALLESNARVAAEIAVALENK
jgi:pseudouridine-5'-phosphate glycosidase